MNDNDEIKIFKPFGPPIGKFEIGQDLINRINKYIDKLVQDKKKSSELDAGKSLAGQVNQEIKFEKEFRSKIKPSDHIPLWIKITT